MLLISYLEEIENCPGLVKKYCVNKPIQKHLLATTTYHLLVLVNRTALALALMLALLISAMTGTLPVKKALADPLYEKAEYHNVTVYSPQNQTYTATPNTLNFTDETNNGLSYLSYCYTLDGNGSDLSGPIWNDLLKVNQTLINSVEISNGTYEPYTDYTFGCTAVLPPTSKVSIL